MMIDSNVFSVYAYILLLFNRLKIYVIRIYKKISKNEYNID